MDGPAMPVPGENVWYNSADDSAFGSANCDLSFSASSAEAIGSSNQ